MGKVGEQFRGWGGVIQFSLEGRMLKAESQKDI